MSAPKANKANPDDRAKFQDLIAKAKDMDFESEFVYIKCPELGPKGRLKIHSMKMSDLEVARKINKELETPLWVSILMASAKDEKGVCIFEGKDAADYIMSKGTSWYNNYGVKCMQISGYLEEFRATKK
jgi:hypothetical protein